MSWLKNETRQMGVEGMLGRGTDDGRGGQPPKRRSPWKTQIVGALTSLAVFIVVGGILWLLYARFR